MLRDACRRSYLLVRGFSHTVATDRGDLLSPDPMATRKMSDGRALSGAWSHLPSRPASGVWPSDVFQSSPKCAPSYNYATQSQPQAMPVTFAMRPLVLFCAAYTALGAGLWVMGLVRDSLALVGLGFLVVFDGLSVLSTVWMQALEVARRKRLDAEQGDASAGAAVSAPVDLKRPFGYVVLTDTACAVSRRCQISRLWCS